MDELDYFRNSLLDIFNRIGRISRVYLFLKCIVVNIKSMYGVCTEDFTDPIRFRKEVNGFNNDLETIRIIKECLDLRGKNF